MKVQKSRRFVLTAMSGAVGSICMPIGALGQDDKDDPTRAPFGLTWGMSAEQVRQLGVSLTPDESSRTAGEAFLATGLPKALSDMDAAKLSFGHDNKLFKIAAIGRAIDRDPYGYATIARYNELVSALSARYGKGDETNVEPQYGGGDSYVMSIRSGRARRFTNFKTKLVSVQIAIRASDMDTSFYVIFFTSVPGEKEFEASKRKREREAL